MPKTSSSPFSLSSFIVSMREFARNSAVRRRALKEQRPVIVEQSRDRGFFVLLPPALYDALFNLYRNLRDSNDLRQAMEEDTEWTDWEDVKRELAA